MAVPPPLSVLGIALLTAIVACASARPERSSHGCMTETLQQHLPADLPDKLAHCVAGGLIARYCSPAEANLAAAGKELRDLLGRGDASRADWQASRIGIACAHQAENDEALRRCCSTAIKKAAPARAPPAQRG